MLILFKILGKALNLIKLGLGNILISHFIINFVIIAFKGLLLRFSGFTNKISSFYTLAAKINAFSLLKLNLINQFIILYSFK
jgi:hypothetical protein